MEADKDGDGKLSFEEFAMMVSNTVYIFVLAILEALSHTFLSGHCKANDS